MIWVGPLNLLFMGSWSLVHTLATFLERSLSVFLRDCERARNAPPWHQAQHRLADVVSTGFLSGDRYVRLLRAGSFSQTENAAAANRQHIGSQVNKGSITRSTEFDPTLSPSLVHHTSPSSSRACHRHIGNILTPLPHGSKRLSLLLLPSSALKAYTVL